MHVLLPSTKHSMFRGGGHIPCSPCCSAPTGDVVSAKRLCVTINLTLKYTYIKHYNYKVFIYIYLIYHILYLEQKFYIRNTITISNQFLIVGLELIIFIRYIIISCIIRSHKPITSIIYRNYLCRFPCDPYNFSLFKCI